jgi:spore maturation protein SpmA
MALNIIWIAFFVIASVVALFKLVFLGDTEILEKHYIPDITFTRNLNMVLILLHIALTE